MWQRSSNVDTYLKESPQTVTMTVLISIFFQFVLRAHVHQCDLTHTREDGTNRRQSGSPLSRVGIAYMKSKIQWYSSLTQAENAKRSVIYSWRLFPLS